jgi:hypothetical protein
MRLGFSAGSRPISWTVLTGRGPVVGDEPLHRTKRSDETDSAPGSFSSDCNLTVHFVP